MKKRQDQYLKIILFLFVAGWSIADDSSKSSKDSGPSKTMTSSKENPGGLKIEKKPGALMSFFKQKVRKNAGPSFFQYVANRVGGAVRGNKHTSVTNLSPEEIGFTAQKQPTLCWYLDAQTSHPVELIIVEHPEDQFQFREPILEHRIEGGFAKGTHCFSLKKTGTKLEREVIYLWSTRILSNELELSDNSVAQSFLVHLEEPPQILALNQGEIFFFDELIRVSGSRRSDLLKSAGLPDYVLEGVVYGQN